MWSRNGAHHALLHDALSNISIHRDCVPCVWFTTSTRFSSQTLLSNEKTSIRRRKCGNDTSRLERHFDTDLFVTSVVTRCLISNRFRRWSLEDVDEIIGVLWSKLDTRDVLDRNSTLPVTFSTMSRGFVIFGMKAIVDQSVSSGCQSGRSSPRASHSTVLIYRRHVFVYFVVSIGLVEPASSK